MKLEIFDNGNLIRELVKQEFKKKYSESFLGFLWYLFEPLILFAVLIFVFTLIFPSTIEYFLVYLLIGLTIYQLFSDGTTISMEKIVVNAGLIKKIYFPREILPIVSIIVAFIGIIFQFIIIFIFMIITGVAFQLTLLFIPVILTLELAIILGAGLMLSALYVKWRDLNVMWKLFTKILFWFIPIFYKMDIVPPNLEFIYYINPITILVEDCRSVILDGTLPSLTHLIYLLLWAGLLLSLGIWIFNRRKKTFAEEI